jgi:hypothetical protein
MPNPAKQLERHSWAAGYADGYIDGLEEAWARINAAIERGPMPQREKDEYRNGLLFACKLMRPQPGEVPAPQPRQRPRTSVWFALVSSESLSSVLAISSRVPQRELSPPLQNTL